MSADEYTYTSDYTGTSYASSTDDDIYEISSVPSSGMRSRGVPGSVLSAPVEQKTLPGKPSMKQGLPSEDAANTAEGKGEHRRMHHEVMRAMVREVDHFTTLSLWQIMILAVEAGAFIAFGALLSAVLSAGIDASGPKTLCTALGFISGFYFVILTGSALFTEVNVAIPVYLLVRGFDVGGVRALRAVLVWGLVLVGNCIGSFLVAVLVYAARNINDTVHERMAELVRGKVDNFDDGAKGWFAAVVSGMLANWLVGLAGYNAMTARTVPGKWFAIAFPILGFVSLGVLHSPANMGYFHIELISRPDSLPDLGVSWGEAWWKSIIPSVIGNALGGIFCVALPFTLAFWYQRPVKGSSK